MDASENPVIYGHWSNMTMAGVLEVVFMTFRKGI
jgi:hypothetical protein